MKRFVAICGAVFLSLALTARGEGPNEKYVLIYNLIQEGDGLLANGQSAPAALKYLEAQSLLKTFPTLYPGWNEKVVNYRLGYLSSKLESLNKFVPTTNAPPAVAASAPTPPPAAVPASAPAPVPAQEERIKALQEEIARLTAQNTLLEGKLKEALSVQPAAADPRELAKADDKIKELTKQIDVLKVSLEQEQAKAAKLVDPAILEQERKLLAEAKARLAEQTEFASTLQKENDGLKQQLAEIRARPGAAPSSDGAGEELHIARAMIAALQATNITLKTEKILLEARLAEVSRESTPATSVKVKELTKERDELRRKLAAANRELSRRKSRSAEWRADNVASQLESVLARLDAYEARAVPYTPEEQALFKQGDDKVGNQVLGAEKKTIKELPPGSGALIAEAQRASADGRFAEAERLYLQVLRQDERHVFTLTSLAAAQLDQNRLDEADATLQRARAVDPRDPAALFLLGRLRYLQGRYDDALEALSLSAKAVPNEAWTQYFLGKTLLQKGSRAAAETALRKAVQLKPGWAEAHHSLALVYATQQPPFKELALWHYTKARDAGYPADPELDKLLEDKSPLAAKP